MDIADIFANEESWIEKVTSKGYTSESLLRIINKMSGVYELIDPFELEDFIYRLKIHADKKSGKKFDAEVDFKMASRACVYVGKKPFFFRICPQETSYKKPEMLFYCELCGLGTKLKCKRLMPHTLIHNSNKNI